MTIQNSPKAANARDYLGNHAPLATLLPAVQRNLGLQADCARFAPALFGPCSVLKCEARQLVIAVPTSALVARLKQQTPSLIVQLQQAGWAVEETRLKLLMTPSTLVRRLKKLPLPNAAHAAFEALEKIIPATPHNAALKTALLTLLKSKR